MFINLKYCLKKYSNSEDIIDIKKYCDTSKKIDKYLRMIQDEKKFNKEQEKDFINILKESILDYIKDMHNEDYEYLAEELDVKIQNSISDKWENDEVVYYFPMHDTFITM